MSSKNHARTFYVGFLEKAISRRDLLRRAILAAAIIPPGAALLAACGEEDDSDTDSVDSGSPANDDDAVGDDSLDEDDADEPASSERRGGTLRIGLAGSVDTMDPHHPVQFEGIWVQSMLYSRLLRLDHELELVPDVATSWEPNEDASQWTFHLRDDVTFHNGRDLTAEDVKASFERIIDPDEAAVVAGEVGMLDSVEVVSDDEIIIHLTSPYADFISLAGMYYMRIVPIEEAEHLDTDPVGSGPYRLGSHSPGERTVLERFDEYYDLENQAFLDSIEYITLAEDASRMTALTSGTIDLISEVPPTSLPMVEDVSGVVVDNVRTGNYTPICMRFDLEPFSDVRVRQAMKLLIDREEYVDAVIRGSGIPAGDHPVPPIDPMHADLPIPEQDFGSARELLTDAGFPDGIDLELHTTAGRVGMQESALTFQEMAQGAGVRVEVSNHPNDVFWSEIYTDVPFFVSNWSARPVADQAFTAGYFESSGWNETKWHNERFEEVVMQAREELDEDARAELMREAQEIMSEDGASIIPYFIVMNGAWSERVQGFHMHPMKWVDVHQVWLEGEA